MSNYVVTTRTTERKIRSSTEQTQTRRSIGNNKGATRAKTDFVQIETKSEAQSKPTAAQKKGKCVQKP